MQDRIDAGEYVRPCDGETLSGDAVLVQWNDDGVLVAVIDVLGHGPDAHKLAMQLSGTLSKWLSRASTPSPEGALEMLHEAARGTRGAVAAVAWLNGRTLEGSVVGIGNVRCRLFGSVARTVEFKEGVLGCRMRSRAPFSFVLRPADVLLLFSDGVTGRFKSQRIPQPYPGPGPGDRLEYRSTFREGNRRCLLRGDAMQMVTLGTLSLSGEAGVLAMRRKLLVAAQRLGVSSGKATRLAAAASDHAKDVTRNAALEVLVGLSGSASAQELCVDFAATYPGADHLVARRLRRGSSP